MKRLFLLFCLLLIHACGWCFNSNNESNKPIIILPNDTLLLANISTYSESDSTLKEINGTTNRIALQTQPQKFLGADSGKSNGYINLFAMVFGLLAATFGFLGYFYQKKSARSLKEMQPKRIPFGVLANNIYDNINKLDILIEIEKSNSNESLKTRRRNYYNSKRLLESIRMPDDLVELSCYEKYKENTIYSEAYSIIMQWRGFNSFLDEVINNHSKVIFNPLDDYLQLKKELMSIFSKFADFENLFREEEINNSKRKNKVLEARTEFLLEKLTKAMYTYGQPSSLLCDPRIFESNILDFLCYAQIDMIFPPIAQILSKKKNIGSETIIDTNNENGLWNKTKKNTYTNLKRILSSWYEIYNFNKGEKVNYEESNNDNIIEDLIKNTLTRLNGCSHGVKQQLIDELFDKWLNAYFNNKESKELVNVRFLLNIINAHEVAELREAMIKQYDTLYSEEKEYFKAKRDTYEDFGLFYSQCENDSCKKITLNNLFSAIVAEQSLKIYIHYLRDWIYCDNESVMELDDYNNIVLLNGENLLPLLDKIGITNNGCIAITTADDLRKVLSIIPDDLLNREIDISEENIAMSFIREFGGWCIKELNTLPYKYIYVKRGGGCRLMEATIDNFTEEYFERNMKADTCHKP